MKYVSILAATLVLAPLGAPLGCAPAPATAVNAAAVDGACTLVVDVSGMQ